MLITIIRFFTLFVVLAVVAAKVSHSTCIGVGGGWCGIMCVFSFILIFLSVSPCISQLFSCPLASLSAHFTQNLPRRKAHPYEWWLSSQANSDDIDNDKVHDMRRMPLKSIAPRKLGSGSEQRGRRKCICTTNLHMPTDRNLNNTAIIQP